MKIHQLLQESIHNILDTIQAKCETDKPVSARYLATIMVLKDMGKLVQTEDNPLQRSTYIDFLFGEAEQAVRAIKLFHKRIQENPRARRLFAKYELQFLDHAYGHQVMINRIETLRPYFTQRKLSRIAYHQDRLIDNLSRAQDKVADQNKDQYDLSNGDKILDDQTFK